MKKWDDNIDKKFSESLEDLHFPFEEDSWDKMNAKLEESVDRPVANFWHQKGYLVFLAIFFISFSSLYSVGYYYDEFEFLNRSEESTKLVISKENIEKNDTPIEQYEPTSIEEQYGADATTAVTNQADLKQVEEFDSNSVDRLMGSNSDLEHNSIKKDNSPISTVDQGGKETADDSNSKVYHEPQNDETVFAEASSSDISSEEQRINLLEIEAKTSQLENNWFWSGAGGIGNLDFSAVELYDEDSGTVEDEKLSKTEKKQLRANAKEVRKKLGKLYRRPISEGEGRFSLKPLNWGIRVGGSLKVIDNPGFLRSSDIGRSIPFEPEGPVFGLYLQYLLKGRWHLQVEFAYSYLANLRKVQDFNSFSTATNFLRFGNRRNLFISYYLDGVEFLDLQTVVQYKFPKRGAVELGAAFGKTVPFESKSSSFSWNSSILRNRPELQFPDAILDVNLQAIVGYEYALSNRFVLNARYYFGLLDLTNDNFFVDGNGDPISKFEGGSRLQISLKANLNRVRRLNLIAICIFSSGCHDDRELIIFGEDFFCDEDKPEVFLKFDIEGDDIFVPGGTALDIDLCNIDNELVANNTSRANIDDLLFSQAFNLNVKTIEYSITIGFIGTFFQDDLDINEDRDFAKNVLGNEMQYKIFSETGLELWTDDNGQLEIPSVRPSFTFIEFMPILEEQAIVYKTDDPCVFIDYPNFCEDYQAGSFMEITAIEEIDYQSPDFPEVRYNYVISGKFQCRVYRQNSQESFLDIRNGSFRLPFNAPKTSDVF